MHPTTYFNVGKTCVERRVLSDTVGGVQPLNINVILYGNEKLNHPLVNLSL